VADGFTIAKTGTAASKRRRGEGGAKKCPEVGLFGVAQSPKLPSHGTVLFITAFAGMAREKKKNS
jgi:hypothetical protein